MKNNSKIGSSLYNDKDTVYIAHAMIIIKYFFTFQPQPLQPSTTYKHTKCINENQSMFC